VSHVFNFSADCDQYGVMGNPISHSLSPIIHAEFARQTGEQIRYEAFLIEPGRFHQAVAAFQTAGGKGLNVTVPFKQDAWRLADVRSPQAQLAGAVNTLWFADGAIHGDTTDGIGLVRDYQDNQGGRIAERRVLILGAGGAVRGVVGAILSEAPRSLLIANRTPAKALEIAELFGDQRMAACSYEALRGRQFDWVINGTSASLQGELLPLPDDLLSPTADCYDMMYSATPTPFVRWGRAHGAARALDGLGMLVEQAAESFRIWRGVRPLTQPVINLLRRDMAH
jgi:shikimate dehydrogenase